MTRVYDASALLAVVFSEPGSDAVEKYLGQAGGMVSAANWAEVGSKMVEKGLKPAELRRELSAFSLDVVALDQEQALLVASLRATTRSLGLSLGDRCCLALAQREKATVITAERSWKKLAGFDIALIR